MVFLDEDYIKSGFITWCKRNQVNIKGKIPDILNNYYDLFFKGNDFFDYTCTIIDQANGDYWRSFVTIVDYIMITSGINTMEIWLDEFSSLSTNYFAFVNEELLDEISTNKKPNNKKILSFIVNNIFKTPEFLFFNIISNSGTILATCKSQMEQLLKSSKINNCFGIFNPVTKKTFEPNVSIEKICTEALSIIPSVILTNDTIITKSSIDFAINSIVKFKPALMLTPSNIKPSSVQLEIIARAIAIKSLNNLDDVNFRSYLNSDDNMYSVNNNFILKYNWANFGDYFGACAYYTSADEIRHYRKLLLHKIELLCNSSKSLLPWNDNVLFKIVIAAVWYIIIFANNIDIGKAYNIIFDEIKKWIV